MTLIAHVWGEPGVLHVLSAQNECGVWALVLCKDCGPQTQPLAFPQLVEQLILVGEKKREKNILNKESTSTQK